MASLSAASLWVSSGTAVWLQEPRKKSADDGMYHPYTSISPAFANPTTANQGLYAPPPITMNGGNAAELPVGPVNGALESQRFDALGRPLQMQLSVPPATTISIATSAVTSTVIWSTFSSLTTMPLSSNTAPAPTSLHHATSPLTILPPPTSTAVTPLLSSSSEPRSKNLTAVAEAGIVLSVISMVLILLGMMILWCVGRKRKALQMYNVVGNDEKTCNEDSVLPEKTATNSVDSPASNLYTRTRGSLTLPTFAEKRFKASCSSILPSINDIPPDGNGAKELAVHRYRLRAQGPLLKYRAYDLIQQWLSVFSSVVRRNMARIRSLGAPRQSAPQQRRRQPYEYGPSEDFLHIPPPEPTRPEKVLARVYTSATSVINVATKNLKLVPHPQSQSQTQLQSQSQVSYKSTSSSTSSEENSCTSAPEAAYVGICDWNRRQYAGQVGLEHETSATRGRSATIQNVLSSVATLQASPNSKGDAVIVRISEEDASDLGARQSLPRSSSESPSPSPPQQAQAQPLPLPVPPKTAHSGSSRHLGISSVITRNTELAGMEFSFASRSTGHLDVAEGQPVRLEHSSEYGWVKIAPTALA